MKINIKTTGIGLTDAITEYVDKKYMPLGKYISGDTRDTTMEVEVGKTTNHHQSGDDLFRVEMMVHMKGKDVRVVSEKSDLYAAIDDAKDEAERVLSTHKDKKATLWKRGAMRIKNMIRGNSGDAE